MEEPYCDEPEIPMKLEIPELIVEWQESDITFESDTFDLYIDPEQISTNFIPVLKFYKWKKDSVHITIAAIFISIILTLGFLWYDNYGPLKSRSVFDMNTLENIYSYVIYNNNYYENIILDKHRLLYQDVTDI
ncbi:MAG TPA: hypothetical protein DHW61_09655 [Lachnoclostridium phytofermentans]|uniref:Uncharacterized protein n=1 Tax=Lachnoclostridium phytofermentans TaxID=66219 RepID=A0A3D2X8H8_9FIRM|nr:hypothetical protein [Lachnoclostridium sp.]HCL02658.1 hypothetical protein [Lachnoclostridium phytofermentans]